MNTITGKTRACTLGAELRAAIRAHGTKFGPVDIERYFNVLLKPLAFTGRKDFQVDKDRIIGGLCHAEMAGVGG